MTRDGIFASHRLNQLEVVPYAVPYPQVDLYGVVRCFPVALPPESALLTARNVLKERPLARGLSSSTAREGYGLAAGMCAGAMPTSYVWTLSSLEPPAELP